MSDFYGVGLVRYGHKYQFKGKEIKMFTTRLFNLLIIIALLMLTACTPQVAATPSEDRPVTLRLAIADEEGRPSDPYVHEFIEQVKTLSKGNITIEPLWDAGANTTAGFEKGTIELVTGGKADLGLAASRAWDTENISSFEALQAPFIIDNDALAIAVAQSDVAQRMLENLSSAGVVGLTLWPEDLRHPFSIPPNKPLLSPNDFAGLNIRITPSDVSNMLIETLGGKPVSSDDDYQGAESGLRQGFSLTGTPTATGNVTFFAKFQVLVANKAAFEKLSDVQRTVLRQAAAATQKKAIAEHPSEVDAATAWCADGGTIVLASNEQIAALEKAAQPVFDQIAQNPLNAEMIASIRELKAKTKPSLAVQACASQTAQQNSAPTAQTEVWSPGLPPNGVWQVELIADDFIKMGSLKSTADDMAGVYTWTFQDGQAKIEIHGPGITVSCMVVAAVVRDAVRLRNVASPDCDGNAYDDVQWRLDADGLHFHLVSSQAVELKTMYESKPWHKVANP
jgi:TRAP-type C4-dicarboxylate transport system substrate-binding protein